jgi:hypothetical protein
VAAGCKREEMRGYGCCMRKRGVIFVNFYMDACK